MRPKPRPIVVRSLPNLTPELLSSLRSRDVRDRRGLYVAEGPRFLHRAIEGGAALAGVAICPFRLHGSYLRETVTRVENAGTPLIRLSVDEYRRISPGSSEGGENSAAGHGVLLILRQAWQPLPDPDPGQLWIGVESVRTPGNLGTLLRSGEAAGATGLVVFDRCEAGTPSGVDPYDPAAVRATMGSLFAHRLVRTTHRNFRRWAKGKVDVYGGALEGSQDYRLGDYRKPVVLMLGDERDGLTPGQLASCNRLVRIPMAGETDSLNLAMAGTLMLYEAFRQRNPVNGLET